jgi:hypothetical protein
VVDALVAESTHPVTLVESKVLGARPLDDQGLARAVAYVERHPDSSAYHALFAVQARSLGAYRRIAPAVRAAVLCSALANLVALNDWGHLTVHVTDGPPALALLELGDAARPCLIPLLHDRRPAQHFGSIEALISSQYRRADYAYRYLSILLGRTPSFDLDPGVRDTAIDALAAELSP